MNEGQMIFVDNQQLNGQCKSRTVVIEADDQHNANPMDKINQFVIEQPKENKNKLFEHITRINQETHMHTLLLGFQGDVTSFRLPKNVIGLLSSKLSKDEITQEQQ